MRELTIGKGADIIFNTVGDPYFQAAHRSLALRGRQILIAAIDRIVQFNILEFYRGQHTYVGVDTLGLSSVASGDALRELGAGFANGKLKPFPINPAAIYSLDNAKRAFDAVADSSRDRIILETVKKKQNRHCEETKRRSNPDCCPAAILRVSFASLAMTKV